MVNRSFLHDFLNPKSIAIVGASNNPMKMGTMHALSLLNDGFKGKFYPIHPREKEILGHRAYTSPKELPETPDLALFVLPAKHLLPVFSEFGEIGTPYAIVITAGFKETGESGAMLEDELKATAKKYKMRFIGPNCMGIINTANHLNTTVSPLPGLNSGHTKGHLGFISQSGTYIAQATGFLEKKGVRFSKAFSLGNEANVNLVDVLRFLGEDEQTKAISLYIEIIRDIPGFLQTAKKISPFKPIIAQYIGGSKAGARAGKSHTGALAGNDRLYNALFAQAGVIRVHSVEELYLFGWTLAEQPSIPGPRIGIITNSGGPGSAMADTLERLGCEVPEFSPSLQEKIKPLVAAHAPCGNPIDLTFALDTKLMTETLAEMILKSGEVDGILIHGAMATGFMRIVFPHLKKLLPGITEKEFLDQTAKQDLNLTTSLPFRLQRPVIISSFFGQEDNFTRAYIQNNVPVFDSPEKAAQAMATMVHSTQVMRRQKKILNTPEVKIRQPNPKAVQIIDQALEHGQSALDEFSAKKFLQAYGFPTVKEYLVQDLEQLAEAGKLLTYPLVAKACDAKILHKSEQGLVKLGISNQNELTRAYTELQDRTGTKIPVLVAQQVKGSREFLAGLNRDKHFGPCLVFGLGGIYAEVLQEIAFCLCPINREEAKNLLCSTKAGNLLGPVRGQKTVDIDCLTDLLCILSLLPTFHPQISSMDLNPIIIDSKGRPIIVDALLTLSTAND